MNLIIDKQQFSENVFQFVVEAPLIARSRRAGHFVIVRVGEKGERIPLTIADSDINKGTITLIVQRVGASTHKLCDLNAGDCITDVVGPLGKATDIRLFGTVVCACGGVGTAPMLPIAKALKQAGNKVICVLAARTKQLIILEEQMRGIADEVVIMTDDGSYGNKGLVTAGVEMVIQREKVDKCITIGPAIMMKFVALLTQKYNVPTEASLNTIMVDGTGMCGACRVTVDGKTRFVCVDGPEFDAHKVDFDEMLSRLRNYTEEEKAALEQYTKTEKSDYSDNSDYSENSDYSKNTDSSKTPDTSRDSDWRIELRNSMKPKERTAIERVLMPELTPEYRVAHRLEEVNQGLTAEQALTEAKRCLDCPNPTCVEGCPVNINIPAFVKNIERGHFLEAAQTIKLSNSLPAVCGRVCPQEKQCESRCIHNRMGHKPVAIGYLERFAADYERESGQMALPPKAQPNGKKIAVIGSGPAGLAFAGDMAKAGFDVTVFEALHDVGGVLKYGIPEFRLPNRIVDVEIQNLERLGVRFEKNVIVGKTVTIDQLKAEGFVGFFVGSGAGFPKFMNIEGENLNGVMSSNEYLTRVNLMQAADSDSDTPVTVARRVAVIGGGNTAMDAARTARRMGAERVMLVYRRSEDEMPARREEIKHAKEEGIEFMTLHNPICYSAQGTHPSQDAPQTSQGRVASMLLQKMQLGEPDESGRRSPVPIEGATELIDVDLVIVAVGVSPNSLIPNSVEGLDISRRGTIVVNDETMQSSIPVIYAGGDIVRGGSTVILAMSDGRRAAKAMSAFLK